MTFSRRNFLRGAAVIVGAVSLRDRIWALAAPNGTGTPVRLLLGVDYYPDQTPEALWEEDARMMADFNLTCAPVVDDADHIIGVITVDDVLEAMLPDSWRRRAEADASSG